MSEIDRLHDEFDRKKDPFQEDDMEEAKPKKQMTCQEFSEYLNDFWSEMNSTAYWTDDFQSERYFDLLRDAAAARNIFLTDAEDFDYEKYFWEQYKCDSDKGLS